MRTVYKYVDTEGTPIQRLPEYAHMNAEIRSVRFCPNIGDPDDPNDIDELEITLEVSELGLDDDTVLDYKEIATQAFKNAETNLRRIGW